MSIIVIKYSLLNFFHKAGNFTPEMISDNIEYEINTQPL